MSITTGMTNDDEEEEGEKYMKLSRIEKTYDKILHERHF